MKNVARWMSKTVAVAGVVVVTMIVTARMALADHGSAYSVRAASSAVRGRVGGSVIGGWVAVAVLLALLVLAYVGVRPFGSTDRRAGTRAWRREARRAFPTSNGSADRAAMVALGLKRE